MTAITKTRALEVLRRAYGPDQARTLAERLPDRIDLDDAGHTRMLADLGVTRDDLFNELGAEF